MMMDSIENADLCSLVKCALKTGCFGDFTADSTPQAIVALRGEPQQNEVKKGIRTLRYPDADFVFEAFGLRQISLRVSNSAQQVSLQALSEEYPGEQADAVAPYFRCFRLATGTGALEEVLITTAFAEKNDILSLTVVFPRRETRKVDVELPCELYGRLQALSARSRRTIGHLCLEMIARGLDSAQAESPFRAEPADRGEATRPAIHEENHPIL